MRLTTRALVVSGLALSFGSTTVQDRQVWVNISIAGKPVMGFVPASKPYIEDGPAVCSAVSEPGKTSDGQQIKAFEFIGWKEGDAYRVQMFAIVPAREVARSGSGCLDQAGTTRAEFETLLIEPGHAFPIEKMAETGMNPGGSAPVSNSPGNREHETCSGGSFLGRFTLGITTFAQDLRQAGRVVRHAPMFAGAAILKILGAVAGLVLAASAQPNPANLAIRDVTH